MRRIILTFAAAVLVAVGLGGVAVATSSGSTITVPRLDRAVATSFSNVYAQEAAIEGHTGITPSSLHAKAMCDRGPNVTQSGPGATWNCLMSWSDPNTPMPPTGYGKFELNVHSNGCFTVGSPSSLIGYQTITDRRGRTVNNPAYEWDSCLDPASNDTPTGTTFPSALTVTSTTVNVTADGTVGVDLACGVGAGGCRGSVAAVTDTGVKLGTVPFTMTEQATTHLKFPTALPAGAKQVTFTATATAGFAPPSPATLAVQG
ncbi:MAG: hypothetical protein ACXVWW_05370 [Nocardioides sp.]